MNSFEWAVLEFCLGLDGFVKVVGIWLGRCFVVVGVVGFLDSWGWAFS